jgi:hypothetical protein
MLNTRLKCCLATTLSLSVMSFSSLATPVTCGPGPHWIDDCPAGTLTTPFATKVQLRIPCDDLTAPTLILRGPVKIQRKAGKALVGSAHFIATNTLSLKWTGHGIKIRAGIQQGIMPPALGQITELASDPRWAEFYVDHYYEVDIHPLGTLHANDVCRIKGFVDRIPPPNPLTQPVEFPCSNMGGLPLPLYDDNEVEVGCLVTEGLD